MHDADDRDEQHDEHGDALTVAERLRNLEGSVHRVEQGLRRIEARLESTQTSCSNMDEHIAFVEGVYSAVRQPLSFLASKFYARPLPLLQEQRERRERRPPDDANLDPASN